MYYEFENCDSEKINQHITEEDSTECENSKNFTSGQVGFELKDRNIDILNQCMTPYIPFSLKVRLPKPDHGKRGYSDKLVDKIRNELYQ